MFRDASAVALLFTLKIYTHRPHYPLGDCADGLLFTLKIYTNTHPLINETPSNFCCYSP